MRTDVTDNTNVEHSFELAKVKFGRIDIVIGNAGVADESNPQRTIQVNLVSPGSKCLIKFRIQLYFQLVYRLES